MTKIHVFDGVTTLTVSGPGEDHIQAIQQRRERRATIYQRWRWINGPAFVELRINVYRPGYITEAVADYDVMKQQWYLRTVNHGNMPVFRQKVSQGVWNYLSLTVDFSVGIYVQIHSNNVRWGLGIPLDSSQYDSVARFGYPNNTLEWIEQYSTLQSNDNVSPCQIEVKDVMMDLYPWYCTGVEALVR